MLAANQRVVRLGRCGGLFVLSLSLIALSTPLTAGHAQEAHRPMRITQVVVSDDGSSVTSFVALSDESGKPLQGQLDFDAQIDGKGTHIASVRPVVDSGTGLSVLLSIDVSGSMTGEPLAQAQSAATSFVDGLLPKDSAAVVTFADSAPSGATFTGDHAALKQSIAAMSAQGSTALYDAVVQSLALAATAPNERRAVILLTDGKDTISTHTREQAIEEARTAKIPIFTIGLGTGADSDLLRALAENSGGQFYTALSPSDVQAVFDALGESLRSVYVLTVPLSKATTANRTLLVSTSLNGTVISDKLPFLAPQAQVAGDSSSGGGVPRYVWLLIPAAAASVVLPLAARAWSRRRRRQRRGKVRGGQAGDAPASPVAGGRAGGEATLQGKLMVIGGPNAGQSAAVGSNPIEIGSDPGCGLRIDEGGGAVAGVHARVWLQSNRLTVHHLARGGQTLLGGKPVEWASLEPGEAIAIGPHVITFSLEGR